MVHLIHLHSKLHMCIQPYHLVAIETHINNSWITFLQCFRLNYCKLYIPKNIFFRKRSVTNNSSTIRQLSLKLFFFRLYSKFKTNLKLNSIFSKEKHGVATHWKKRRKLREPRNAIETKRNWMSCFISILSREEIAALHRGSLNSRHFPRILDWKSRHSTFHGVYSNQCLVEHTLYAWDWYEFQKGKCNYIERRGVERKCLL